MSNFKEIWVKYINSLKKEENKNTKISTKNIWSYVVVPGMKFININIQDGWPGSPVDLAEVRLFFLHFTIVNIIL